MQRDNSSSAEWWSLNSSQAGCASPWISEFTSTAAEMGSSEVLKPPICNGNWYKAAWACTMKWTIHSFGQTISLKHRGCCSAGCKQTASDLTTLGTACCVITLGLHYTCTTQSIIIRDREPFILQEHFKHYICAAAICWSTSCCLVTLLPLARMKFPVWQSHGVHHEHCSCPWNTDVSLQSQPWGSTFPSTHSSAPTPCSPGAALRIPQTSDSEGPFLPQWSELHSAQHQWLASGEMLREALSIVREAEEQKKNTVAEKGGITCSGSSSRSVAKLTFLTVNSQHRDSVSWCPHVPMLRRAVIFSSEHTGG